ncbi:MAG: DMT family transporter [Nostoc sp. DedQUE12b]|uniref:DMT family transporter n=1 Tax=unclassified Nostoc TaxID=2593658 RepID=UPI002AD28948|nr:MULTISPECIES: DMT family transporter [unclassified Nostoc]MDZ7955458.1 DMT family transporter [Nostoc sp. DedQUE09]MDZ8088633.1 DMT family transporter [Nostoc sp. DedQUE12b]
MPPENTLRFKGIMLLIFVNLSGATTFPLTKDIVSSLSPSALIASRFVIAAAVFALNLRNINAILFRHGTVLGLLLFFLLAIETIALKTIPANRAAFIVSLSALIVPLLGWLSGKRVLLRTFLTAGVAVIGIGIMFWEGGELRIGDLLMFIDTFIYAAYLIFLERVAPRHPTLPLTSVQLMFVAVLGVLWNNTQILNQFEVIRQHWVVILYLGLVSTAAVIWFQTLAQQWVSSDEAALLYTLEPLFATIFSFSLLGEHLGIRGLIGAILVLLALVLSQSPQKIEPEAKFEVQNS